VEHSIYQVKTESSFKHHTMGKKGAKLLGAGRNKLAIGDGSQQ